MKRDAGYVKNYTHHHQYRCDIDGSTGNEAGTHVAGFFRNSHWYCGFDYRRAWQKKELMSLYARDLRFVLNTGEQSVCCFSFHSSITILYQFFLRSGFCERFLFIISGQRIVSRRSDQSNTEWHLSNHWSLLWKRRPCGAPLVSYMLRVLICWFSYADRWHCASTCLFYIYQLFLFLN